MSSETGLEDMSLIDLFRSEVETHSDLLSAALLALERSPNDTSRIDEMMRAAHSIKGAARVVGVDAAVPVAHVMEDCFLAAQKGAIKLTPGDVDVLLRGVDLLGKISEATRDPNADLAGKFSHLVQELVAELETVLSGKGKAGSGGALTASGGMDAGASQATTAQKSEAAAPGALLPTSPTASDITISFPETLDSVAAEEIRKQLLAAIDSGCPKIRFDLRATRDLDVQGLALLATVPSHLANYNRPAPELTGVSLEMATVLRVTGLAEAFGVRRDPARGQVVMETRADEFVTQAREHLAVLEQVLLSLEKPEEAADNHQRIDRCLRLVHSLKGDAGFLGYAAIRILANAMETVLEHMRNEEAPASAAVIEQLLVARDRLATLVDDLEGSREADLREILSQLDRVEGLWHRAPRQWDIDLRQLDRQRSGRLAEFFSTFERCGHVTDSSITMASSDLARAVPQGSIHFRARLISSMQAEEIRQTLGLPIIAMEGEAERALPLSIDLAEWVRASGRPLGTLLADLERLGTLENPGLDFARGNLATSLPAGPVLLRIQLRTALSQADVDGQLRLPIPRILPQPPSAAIASQATGVPSMAPQPESAQPTVQGAAARTLAQDHDKTASLRISVELLDRLMTLTGELTLIRNQSVLAFEQDDGPHRPIVQRLDAVTSALQETVLRTRMQPIGNLFGKFPRVVRDLGRQLGKQVEMTIVGRDVELDKTILEQLSDPLTHLVRNSVDHGIETPAERIAKDKPATGQITLTAAHEDGQVRIEIRDDGRGIDHQAVRTKALAMRLKTESELDRMSPRELMGLILLPGFSTARQVTEVSGRGVGMDVVKTNIELLEGSLVIDSLPGLGTAMILRMPLTLAIIPCLIVTVNGERYAIPQRELEEAVCLHPGMSGRIEQAFDTEVYRLRDRLLPIVRLRDVLSRPHPFSAESKAEILATHAANVEPARIEYILVLRLPGRRFGLVVDEVRGTEEVVVKPMHASIKRVGIFTGATIMGDGRVALIADVAGIVEHARLSFDSAVESAAKVADARKSAQAHRVLLFEYGPHEQFALPLLQIRRIEMVGRDRVERVGGHEYVTVDGVSMRILRLDKLINVSAPEETSAESVPQMSLILPKFGNQAMAILVSRIVDTESLSVNLQENPEQDQGILGSAVVRGRLTLFLDIHRLSQKLFGRPLPAPTGAIATQRPRRLLLIDDTPFFREVVKRYLIAEGHEVDTAENGEDALDQLAKGREFDLIVSDIEMPLMDGWEFARKARRRGVKTPMLALTSLSGIPYEVKAKDCGYDSYEVKLDHDRLVRKVGNLLAVQDLLK